MLKVTSCSEFDIYSTVRFRIALAQDRIEASKLALTGTSLHFQKHSSCTVDIAIDRQYTSLTFLGNVSLSFN